MAELLCLITASTLPCTVLSGISSSSMRGNYRRFVLCTLLLMILVNIVLRWPLYHSTPHGSDTLAILELSRTLANDSQANWIISPWSYFGMYPLSYPSGTMFAFAELQVFTGLDWDAVPWVSNIIFSSLLVLAGFMLMRTFRVSPGLSAIMSGLMASSPFFLLFTYGQASTRGLIVPLLVMAIFVIFWKKGSTVPRILIVSSLTIGALSIHRSAFVIVILVVLAGIVILVLPEIMRFLPRVRSAYYAAWVSFGAFVITWPFIPGLKELYLKIPEISSSYRIGEIEFQTGFLLEGDTPFVILANLGANYFGSLGPALFLIPFALFALFPDSVETRDQDIFLITILVLFAFLIWNVQYTQLLIFPFIYLSASITIERWRKVRVGISRLAGFIIRRPESSRRQCHRSLVIKTVSVLVVLSLSFSVLMLAQRGTVVEHNTGQLNWATGCTVNVGDYLGATDFDSPKVFVSNAGYLDRRVRWSSTWISPVTDSVVLKAYGYLEANSSSFTLDPTVRDSFIEFLFSFYRLNRIYELSPEVPDRDLYYLSLNDAYGILRLYFIDPDNAIMAPKSSTGEAQVSILVMMNSLGPDVRNPFTLEGTVENRFFTEAALSTYMAYCDGEYSCYLLASPSHYLPLS